MKNWQSDKQYKRTSKLSYIIELCVTLLATPLTKQPLKLTLKNNFINYNFDYVCIKLQNLKQIQDDELRYKNNRRGRR